jgi:hypothetical protein
MDRQTVYFGQLARETDLLLAQQNTMVALAKLSGAVLGLTTIVNGFTCTPTGPASLNVLLTPGEVYQLENIEQSTWSSLSTNTNTILKQGVILSNTQLAITPPGTVGFSQNYLIEVQYQDLDTGSTVLPYYNAANPSLPFSGPGNSGSSQNTVRQGIVAIQAKAGIAATTGTQTTPSADAGWTGVFVVTVANGQSTITSGNISQVAAAPFIPVTLPNVPAGVQSGKWVYGADTGTASNLVVTQAPAVTSYTAGMWVVTKAAAAPVGASVINVNALGNKSIMNVDGSAIGIGQWFTGSMLILWFDGTNFQLVSQTRQPGTPVYLQASTTFFVNTSTGNDSTGNGTAGAPWATLQYAYNWVQQHYASAGVVITFNCNGTFTSGVSMGAPIVGATGSTSVVWTFTTGSSISATNSSCITVANGCQCTVQGTVTFSATGTSSGQGYGLLVSGVGYIATQGTGLIFGNCANAGMATIGAGANILVNASYVIGGSGISHLYANLGGNTALQPGVSGTVSGTPTFSSAFALASNEGIINCNGASFSGSATGQRYNSSTGAIIITAGGGASFFPGSVAGTVNLNGGVYGNGTGQYV